MEISLGRAFFGVAVMSSGLLQLVTGNFVRLVPTLPAWIPARAAWPYLVGAVLLVAGLAILWDRTARTAAAVVGTLILLMVVLLSLPDLVTNPVMDRPFLHGFMWTKPLKALALIGAAAILTQRPRLSSLGAVFLAVFLAVCGIQHFVYNDFTTALVPAWMPGRRFWAYFAGVALVAGGTGMLLPRTQTARLAATLSAAMIFLWVLMLHIPRALAGPQHAFEAAGIFEALALSGAALLVSGTQKR